MDHIDVHKTESQLCILGEGGQLREPRIRTTPERFAPVLGDRPQTKMSIANTRRSSRAQGHRRETGAAAARAAAGDGVGTMAAR